MRGRLYRALLEGIFDNRDFKNRVKDEDSSRFSCILYSPHFFSSVQLSRNFVGIYLQLIFRVYLNLSQNTRSQCFKEKDNFGLLGRILSPLSFMSFVVKITLYLGSRKENNKTIKIVRDITLCSVQQES